MSITSSPSSSGMSTAQKLRSVASAGCLPLRVRVKTPKIVIRPTVGLRVGLDMTMQEIMFAALTFNDRFTKSEQEITGHLCHPVDITISNAKSENTEAAVGVQASTTVREALMYEDMDRVLFEIRPPSVRKNLCPCMHSQFLC